MAFSSAIQLMAFASVTQASSGAEGPANALFDKPTASATVPQRRILNYSQYIYNALPWNSSQDSCEDDYQCRVGYVCNLVDIYTLPENAPPGAMWTSSTSYQARRCDGVDGIEGFLQNYNWGFSILGTYVMSSVSLLVAFLSGLPSRWTRGDYSTLSAILLQFGSTAYGIYDVKSRREFHDLRVSAVPFLLSYPFLFFGIKSASRQRVMKMKATKFMIGMAFFTLIPGFVLGYLAYERIELFGRKTHMEHKSFYY